LKPLALDPALLQLRPATPDDREFLWWLHRETMRVFVDRTWGWDDRWQRARFDANFDAAPLRIIEYGTRAIGYISVQRRGSEVFLAAIEIAPEFQSQGIGTRLIGILWTRQTGYVLPHGPSSSRKSGPEAVRTRISVRR